MLDIKSPGTLSGTKALIDTCVDGHGRCNRISPTSQVRLPTRLIDCTDLEHPRLVLTQDKVGRYLALSYVWGEEEPYQTTASNISAHLAGIDTSLLPQTILDAIYVTHILGVEYLWADSLCIVQDEDEDKLHEIGHMHLIYRRAYFTIIAASAKRVSEGFLRDGQTARRDITLPFICPTRPPAPGSPADVQQVGEVHLSDKSYFSDPREPVDRRGWCLQELCMSPRALIFTSRTLRFKCQEATRTVGNCPFNVTDEVRLPDALFHSPPQPLGYPSQDWFSVHRRWRDIVHNYTGRSLGKASDRLVACGALAKAFHGVLCSDYLAGLWRHTLLQDLLWYTRDQEGEPGRAHRLMEYRAPSWSWASVDGDVRHSTLSNDGVTAVAEVVSCEVKLKNPQYPFGEVTDGFLQLDAALIRCKVRVGGSSRWGADVLVPPTCHEHCSRNSEDVDEDDAIVGGELHATCYVDQLADISIERESAWLVPLLRQKAHTALIGLVVVLAETHSASRLGSSKKAYRRIGRFSSDWSWGTLKHYALKEAGVIEII